MSPSVVIFIPYFGAWPEWIELFFETARRNHDVDFLVYTDCGFSAFGGRNIHFRAMSFQEYVDRAREWLGFSFDPPNAYKLCDLRPMFGALHQDEFAGYDFYGWCDTDLLFGDIRRFYTADVLARYDVLSTHTDRISGHFALFRNCRRNRAIYRRIYRWRDALREGQFVGIDEHGITNAYLMTPFDRVSEKFGWSVQNFVARAWAAHRRRRMYLKEQYTTPFLPIPWLDGTLDSEQPDVWFYRDGRVTNNRDEGREFLYLHLMNFKSSRWRHDGTKAPWEGLARVCRASPADMASGIVIDASGIAPAPQRTP